MSYFNGPSRASQALSPTFPTPVFHESTDKVKIGKNTLRLDTSVSPTARSVPPLHTCLPAQGRRPTTRLILGLRCAGGYRGGERICRESTLGDLKDVWFRVDAEWRCVLRHRRRPRGATLVLHGARRMQVRGSELQDLGWRTNADALRPRRCGSRCACVHWPGAGETARCVTAVIVDATRSAFQRAGRRFGDADSAARGAPADA